MALATVAAATDLRHARARSRLRRGDVWLGTTALAAAMLALPLAPSRWQGPEVAATLAVAATSLLARQRWAIAIVVLAELMLAPTVASAAFSGGLALWPGRLAALGSLLAIVPGMLALRRAAAALVLITGRPRTRAWCRRAQAMLVALGLAASIAPMI